MKNKRQIQIEAKQQTIKSYDCNRTKLIPSDTNTLNPENAISPSKRQWKFTSTEMKEMHAETEWERIKTVDASNNSSKKNCCFNCFTLGTLFYVIRLPHDAFKHLFARASHLCLCLALNCLLPVHQFILCFNLTHNLHEPHDFKPESNIFYLTKYTQYSQCEQHSNSISTWEDSEFNIKCTI